MFKVNNENTRATSFYTPWKHQKTRDFLAFSGGIERSRSSVFIVNFEDISHLFLVFLLLTFSKKILAGIGLHSVILTFDPFHGTDLLKYGEAYGFRMFSRV